MSRSISISLVSTLLLLTAGCQSMADGLLSIEGRAVVLDDQSASPGDPLSNFDANDVDISGFGAHAALSTPIVDVQGGIDQREYADESASEITLGVRRRFLELYRFHPFVEANLRFTSGLETGISKEDAFGWSAGVGLLVDLTDSLFVNVRLAYETTDVDQAGGDTEIDGVIGTIGVGLYL